jgi:hypothetical protein
MCHVARSNVHRTDLRPSWTKPPFVRPRPEAAHGPPRQPSAHKTESGKEPSGREVGRTLFEAQGFPPLVRSALEPTLTLGRKIDGDGPPSRSIAGLRDLILAPDSGSGARHTNQPVRRSLDRYPDIHGIRALNSCRARLNPYSGVRPLRSVAPACAATRKRVTAGGNICSAGGRKAPEAGMGHAGRAGHCCILGSCVGSAYMGGQPRLGASGRSS